nr:hypothetical protein [Tanacetum cinerariifolium]
MFLQPITTKRIAKEIVFKGSYKLRFVVLAILAPQVLYSYYMHGPWWVNGVRDIVSTNTSTSGISPDVDELKDMVKALLLDKKSQNQAPATVRAVEESCVVENKPEATNDTVTHPNNGSTEDVQPPVVPTESLILNSEPVNSPIIEPVASPISAPKPNPKSSIPYPSRRNDERNR